MEKTRHYRWTSSFAAFTTYSVAFTSDGSASWFSKWIYGDLSGINWRSEHDGRKKWDSEIERQSITSICDGISTSPAASETRNVLLFSKHVGIISKNNEQKETTTRFV